MKMTLSKTSNRKLSPMNLKTILQLDDRPEQSAAIRFASQFSLVNT